MVQVRGSFLHRGNPITFAAQPVLGNLLQDARKNTSAQPLMGNSGSAAKIVRPGKKDMLRNFGERRGSFPGDAGPIMMEKQRGAVVDKVELPMPIEQVRVARSTIHILDESIEPDPERSNLRGSSIFRGRVEHSRAWKVIQPNIDAVRGLEKATDFVVGLIAAEGSIDVDKDNLGYAQAQRPADFAGDEFCDQCKGSLAGAPKFYDVKPEVLGLGDRGERASLAEGEDIAGCVDGPEHYPFSLAGAEMLPPPPPSERPIPATEERVGGTRSGTPSVVVAPLRACDGTFWTYTRLLLNRGTLLDPQTEPLVNTSFAHLDPSATSILLEEVGDPKFMNRHAGVSGGAISQDQAYFLNKSLVAINPARLAVGRPADLLDNPLVLTTVLNSLHNPDNNVRAAGLDTLRKVKGVEQRPEFRAAMEQLQNDNNPRLKLIAASVLQGKKLSEPSER